MKIVGINGSPRPQSNSELLLDFVLCELSRTDEFLTYNLHEQKISCNGCERCFKESHVHNDGIDNICAAMLASDLIILSTPVHYGMPSGILKVFMDRTDSLWHEKLLRGKLGGIIVNGASQFEGIELCIKNLQHFFYSHDMISMTHAGCVANTTTYPNTKLPTPLPPELADTLYALVEDIHHMSELID